MQVLYERCAGMDVHKDSVVVCVAVPGERGRALKEIRTFGTSTRELLKLRDWLDEQGVTHGVIESTGVYWKPVYNLLEGGPEIWLANAQQVRNLPGRKTDVADCEWLVDLMRHGLIRKSFVPDAETRELRELTRYRTQLVRERASEVNRIQKILEGANLKLGSVASDVVGQSGTAMLEAIVAGETDPEKLASLAVGRLAAKKDRLIPALEGRITQHTRFMLRKVLDHVHTLDELINELSGEVEERLRPMQAAIDRLDQIPGIGRRAAETLLAEIGLDMSRFPTGNHLASWAGVCPGNNQSAGKRYSGKTRRGSPWLRCALVEAAWSAIRVKKSYFSAQYGRLKGRRGAKKAAVAVAHSILIIAYNLLKNQTDYKDLGREHFDRLDKDRLAHKLKLRIESLGFKVQIEEKKPA